MDPNERPEGKSVTIDKDAQISVVVNRPDSDETTIDLGRVFHNMKKKRRVFAWLLVLCLLVGLCAPLLMYQMNKPMLTVSSAVTLNYRVPGPNGTQVQVSSLTAPDGGELDLSQITSSYVLQNALSGMELSQAVPLGALRNNITIQRVLTDDSRRAQELAQKMTDDKNNLAYQQAQSVALTYDKKFVVALTNGFKENEESKTVIELEDAELRQVLNRILAAYNDYLVLTYADMKLPDDEISVIDVENLDVLESLDLLRTASDNLYAYCEGQPSAIRAYRSYRDGRSLNDWMQTIQTGREVSIDYLYSYIYTNSIVRDRDAMITNYQYQLRNTQTRLDTVNDNITTIKTILENYKNDEIFVSMQESDASKSTRTTTDYYNSLILQQAGNYEQQAKTEITIADLNDKIQNLEAMSDKASGALNEEIEGELKKTVAACTQVYQSVRTHMEELQSSPFYTTYIEHTDAAGRLPGFLAANIKKLLIGGVAGAVIALGIWFLAALVPEFTRNVKEEEKEKAVIGKAEKGEEVAE